MSVARLDHIPGFNIDRVAAAAGEDPDVLRLENLDTDIPPPAEVIEATRAAIGEDEANSWLPFTGRDDLKEAVAGYIERRGGPRYDGRREIVITSGEGEAMLDALFCLTDPGDEVVLTDPTYAGLVNRVRIVGGEPRYAPFAVDASEWRLDTQALSSVVGPRTKALLLMSPSMPSGAVLTEADWQMVCDLCRERDLLLIYDAAMERLLFDGRPLVHPLRFDGMAERTLVVGSLSKEFRMIGWRVGWVAGPAELIADVGWAHVYNTTTPVGIARAPATAVLRGDHGHVEECVRELQRRRDTIFEQLPGWPLVRPGGGWSLLLDAVALGADAASVSEALLRDGAIAATAMTGWGDEVAGRHVRFVFSAEPVERLATLAERLAATGLRAG
jgi:aspartate/methionine/tyrosine aminotransferase